MSHDIPHPTTFERSCQHWSEQGRTGMDAFYRLATLDYQLLAEQLDWTQLFRMASTRLGSPAHLLDVACGSGKFPRALLQHTDVTSWEDIRVHYSLLDPSEFSLSEAKSHLRPPFYPAKEHACTIQALECPAGENAIVWATHALYCVPPNELHSAIKQMVRVLNPEGLGFIAHAGREAHYVRFHDIYLRSIRDGVGDPYSSGEDILTTFREDFPEVPLVTWTIRYEGTIPDQDQTTVEGYLQRCLFDNDIGLEEMLHHPELGEYLRGCHDEQQGSWKFPQMVHLIFFGELARRVEDWKR